MTRPVSISIICCSVTVLCWMGIPASSAQQFNYEIEKRVLERLDFYLGGPADVGKFIDNFRTNGGFRNNMEATDRDDFLITAYSVSQPLVYIGLEDGTCPGYYKSNGYYREPGNAGYSVDNVAMEKHLWSCVDSSGEPAKCLLAPGADYIACEDDLGNESGLCERMEPCPNQPDCNLIPYPSQRERCEADRKWCRKYTIKQAPSDVESTGLGFVPITNFCVDKRGHFSQEEGQILDPNAFVRDVEDADLQSCTYGDGSLVKRSLTGQFAACGGDGKVCNNAFEGGYSSGEYDPRYRPWYIRTKELQQPHWMPPFAFFSLGLGITYATPIYTKDESTGRDVFAGVIAVDYTFDDISNFLVESYGNATTAVIIYEDAEPHYMVGASTGSATNRLMLNSDLSQPCPVSTGEAVPCTPVRIPVSEFGETETDIALVRAYERHSAEDYPRDLLSVKSSDDVDSKIYVSQSTLYGQDGTQLTWRVIVVAPGVKSTADTITGGETLGAICAIGGIGFAICSAFFWVMYSKRDEKAVIFSDWRFTCAFIFGCILLNGSTFTLIGDNTDASCLARMWTFHMFFVMTLAPLFVKVWRIHQLVGTPTFQRTTISNMQAIMYMMPMIALQAVILLIFTFADPPKQTEVIENSDGVVLQRIVCDTETNALMITQIIFEAGFVFAGCVLAYMTRNLNKDFGEAKQLIFAMYNIALVGVVVLLVMNVAHMDSNGESILQAIGVFWGTVFSAAAFVVPRMIRVTKDSRSGSSTKRRTHVSGFQVPAAGNRQFISGISMSGIPNTTFFADDPPPIEEGDETSSSPNGSNKESEPEANQNAVSDKPQEKAPETQQGWHLDKSDGSARRVDWTGKPKEVNNL